MYELQNQSLKIYNNNKNNKHHTTKGQQDVYNVQGITISVLWGSKYLYTYTVSGHLEEQNRIHGWNELVLDAPATCTCRYYNRINVKLVETTWYMYMKVMCVIKSWVHNLYLNATCFPIDVLPFFYPECIFIFFRLLFNSLLEKN